MCSYNDESEFVQSNQNSSNLNVILMNIRRLQNIMVSYYVWYLC